MLPRKRKDMDSPVSLSAKEGTSTGASCEEVLEVIQDELLKLEERAASSAGKLTEAEAKNNSRVVQIVCLNIRSLFLNSGTGGGTCEKTLQDMLDFISSVVMSEEIGTERLSAAVERVFGISRNQQVRGTTLARQHASQETSAISLTRQPQSYGPKAKLDLDFVWNWFHNDCDLITVDKSRKGFYSRRSFRCAGKLRRLVCQ